MKIHKQDNVAFGDAVFVKFASWNCPKERPKIAKDFAVNIKKAISEEGTVAFSFPDAYHAIVANGNEKEILQPLKREFIKLKNYYEDNYLGHSEYEKARTAKNAASDIYSEALLKIANTITTKRIDYDG